MPKINATVVKNVLIPFPPKDELREVLRRLDSSLANTSAVEITTASLRTRTSALDQSILARAFRGELVPQDPNDEPASALLDRIRAEREAAEAESKAKKKAASRPRKKAAKKKSGARKRRSADTKGAT